MKKDLISWGTFYPPMRAFKRLFNNMEDLLEHCPGFPNSGQLSLGVNLSEDERNYEVSAELPGVRKEAIKVEVTDNILIIRAHKGENKKTEGKQYHKTECSYGEFYREIPLTKTIEADKVQADFKDGILHIIIPKKSSNSKTIPINEGKNMQENMHNSPTDDHSSYSSYSHSSKPNEKTSEFTLKHKREEPYHSKSAEEDSEAKPNEFTNEFSLKYKSEEPHQSKSHDESHDAHNENRTMEHENLLHQDNKPRTGKEPQKGENK